MTALSIATSAAAATVKHSAWGKTPDGKPVELFRLSQGKVEVEITTFGARVVRIQTPDRDGTVADIALGYDSLSGYLADRNTYFGAIVGRYGNRIGAGKFTLNGKTYQVPANNDGNALHGGTIGFDQKVWTATQLPDGVKLSLISPDGEMGFPGKLTIHVTYTLTMIEGQPALKIEYEATTDQATVLNLTNHTYFNLTGKPGSNILGQQVMLNADHYTPVDKALIPTGNMDSVAGTPMDFRTPRTVGQSINDNFEQLHLARGYDHNWILNGPNGVMKTAAIVTDPSNGRTLTVSTTEPGVQFYTGNFLDGNAIGHGGTKYPFRGAFCLETQHYPDSPNHPGFPTTVLLPGKTMHSTTIFRFGVQH